MRLLAWQNRCFGNRRGGNLDAKGQHWLTW